MSDARGEGSAQAIGPIGHQRTFRPNRTPGAADPRFIADMYNQRGAVPNAALRKPISPARTSTKLPG
jgi:hypothetical protein